MGDENAVSEAIEGAFPGATLNIKIHEGRFTLEFRQNGLLRPLGGAEVSDGTMRYLLWLAALLSPRPPSMMVLNEPETSLHPELLPALAGLIIKAAQTTQIWVVTHSHKLISFLQQNPNAHLIELEKELGQTQIKGQSQNLLERPQWRWVE
jgi:predicted ATPase